MKTKKENKFAIFHALMRQFNATADDKKIMISHISKEETTSIRTLYSKYPDLYETLIKNLKTRVNELPVINDPKADIWRKRCIAAISAWIDTKGFKPDNRMDYIKTIACRTVEKQSNYFNKLTIAQLRNIYNGFINQRNAIEKAANIDKLFTTNKN